MATAYRYERLRLGYLYERLGPDTSDVIVPIRENQTMNDHSHVVKVLGELREDLRQRPEQWENPTLDRYLEAAGAWLGDWQSKHDEPLTWELVAKLFLAAKIYE